MTKRWKKLWLLLGLSLSAITGTFLYIYALPWMPHFAFLKGQRVEYETNLGLGGTVTFCYNVQRPFAAYHKLVDSELRARGYIVLNKRDNWIDYSNGDSDNPISITIDKGRITGKHFYFDGDWLETDDDPKWTNVTITALDARTYLRIHLTGS
ncbi:MAG TPA: hypothetical protein VFG65_00660 [Fimbriimonadales bacterium]|jgi:hypothetical protein|nr:hypothetical protein [Fimbriimonadales bacterium]